MQVEVTDADRGAAKSLLGRDDAGPSWWSIDSGNADSDPMVQAFARHRIAERKRVVGEIVAWLRDDEEPYPDSYDIADEIEAKFGDSND